MKTAISLPDDLFAAADVLAHRLGVSRSELYATAVAEYLAKHDPDEITRRLNALYADEPSEMDPGLLRMQRRSVGPDQW